MTIRIAIIGFGKIARAEHLPAIAANPDFELVAVTSRGGDPGIGVPAFNDAADLLKQTGDALDAVVVATPPHVRYEIAQAALEAGLCVLLEKPPATTLGEVEDLERIARKRGAALYAAWHSQHAAAVSTAAGLLQGAEIARLRISWLEDVLKYHPGQEWIWEPHGFGVFDPGINALSIATAILPCPLFVRDAVLHIPANRHAPIAAELSFAGPDASALFDWRLSEGEEWTIGVETTAGDTVKLCEGGNRLFVNGTELETGVRGEYPPIYRRFAELCSTREVKVDREPLRIMADAALVARRETVAPFFWTQTG